MAKVIQLRNESWFIHWIINTTQGNSGNTRFLIPDRQSNFLLEWKKNVRSNQVESLTLSMSVLEAGKTGYVSLWLFFYFRMKMVRNFESKLGRNALVLRVYIQFCQD